MINAIMTIQSTISGERRLSKIPLFIKGIVNKIDNPPETIAVGPEL